MRETRRIDLSPKNGNLFSLCWVGDNLVDYGGGLTRYSLDGKNQNLRMGFGKDFDRAIFLEKRGYAVSYESRGTKGFVLSGDRIVREINRSYYHADDYEYPVAIFEWFDGRTVIAHCPEDYNRLEIEEIESGEKVVTRQTESPDFFHSRLSVSPDGRYLLSAGWVWQPWDVAVYFDLKAVAENPELLDQNELGISGEKSEETASASFLDSNRILFSGPNTDDAKERYFLGVHDLNDRKTVLEIETETAAGIMMPLGDHVVTFYEHPRLLELATGKVIQEWPDISSGTQWSSILRGQSKVAPLLALDPMRNRFAVGSPAKISVVELK